MKEIPPLPSYGELATALTEAKTNANAAQIHGLFCGYISATSGKMDKQWEKTVFGNKKIQPACRELLVQLYEISYHQMSEFSFEFSLLLPDDDTNINFRTENLGLWCQGFLTGLEQSDVPLKNRDASELTEALDDIVEVAQVNFGDIADDDEDETAYFELVEYVRLAALMIFQELKSSNPNNTSDESNLLH
jgi:uncharacterized protein